MNSRLESPCVKICQYDQARGLCVGCLRTLDEIGRWSMMSAGERRRVMDELPGRATA